MFVSVSGYIIPLSQLPRRAMAMNETHEKSEFLISYLWVASMIARPILGWLADRPLISCVHLNNVLVLLAGVISLFSPYYDNYGALGFYAAVFGFFTGNFWFSFFNWLLLIFIKNVCLFAFYLC